MCRSRYKCWQYSWVFGFFLALSNVPMILYISSPTPILMPTCCMLDRKELNSHKLLAVFQLSGVKLRFQISVPPPWHGHSSGPPGT